MWRKTGHLSLKKRKNLLYSVFENKNILSAKRWYLKCVNWIQHCNFMVRNRYQFIFVFFVFTQTYELISWKKTFNRQVPYFDMMGLYNNRQNNRWNYQKCVMRSSACSLKLFLDDPRIFLKIVIVLTVIQWLQIFFCETEVGSGNSNGQGNKTKEEGREGEEKSARSAPTGPGAQTRDLPRARRRSPAARHGGCLDKQAFPCL